MALITPTTKLEAVNECLENIGQAPVSTLAGDLGVDTQIAVNFVDKTNRALQSQGWYWNTDELFPLTPNGDSDILIPANTLAIRPDGNDKHRKLVQRGNRLYDRDERTYAFTKGVTVTITFGLDFTDLPETARRFIAMRAARQFQNRIESREDEGDFRDEMDAMADLKADQMRTENSNMLTDNWSIAGTLRRHKYGYTPNQ